MADIYNQEDSKKIYLLEQLHMLYNQTSKHSNYQMLPSKLNDLLSNIDKPVKSKYERERLAYILKHLSLKDKYILDIGGNTGYFTFEAIEAGAKKVAYYEGNKVHAKFVENATEFLEFQDRVEVYPTYFDFTVRRTPKYDIVFNLNVIHHLGDDFGAENDKSHAMNSMLDCINNLAYETEHMVFQMGFNWKGNPVESLFPNGTKADMIAYLSEGVKGYWEILHIGIAEVNPDITFRDLSDKNIRRNDEIGEFLNRPIFIMRSLK